VLRWARRGAAEAGDHPDHIRASQHRTNRIRTLLDKDRYSGCSTVAMSRHPGKTQTRAWRHARVAALTPAQRRSPPAEVPYHLRHAAVSLRLNAGVPATQGAEWAGHGGHVLLQVDAKGIDGQDEAARRRIEAALRVDEDQGDVG
jgi:hypothetical protein